MRNNKRKIEIRKKAETKFLSWGSKGVAVVSALASTHQCGPGSYPSVDTICGLTLLFILSLAQKGFYLGTPVFPSPQKPTLPNSNSIWSAQTCSNKFLRTPKCSVGKLITVIQNYNIISSQSINFIDDKQNLLIY